MWLKAGSILFILPVILLLVVYTSDMNSISDCLAQELTYDPTSGQCSPDAETPPTFYLRHTLLVNLSLLVSIIGTLGMTWGMMLKGLTRAPEER